MLHAVGGKNAVVNTGREFGRIVVPDGVPGGFRLFYTTIDFDGRIDDRIRAFVAPAQLSSGHQVHGATILHAPVDELQCDALWSDRPQTALAIKVSDCLPVSIIDPQHAVMANIHAGWRGAAQRIVDVTLDAIPLPHSAWLGPSIRVCCFEVGEEVAAQFPETFVVRDKAKPHVDIAAYIAARLRARGVERVHDSGLCTRCDGSIFHSFRRDGRGGGRNLAILTMD